MQSEIVLRWAGRLAIGAAAGLLAASVIGRAEAGRYARSERPYWEVGRLDPALTDACRRSVFNQIHDQRLHIGFGGEAGAGTVGVAKLGWNLRDLTGLARPRVTYHFFNDGHSTCRVFVAGR
ncbi:MAG: hypothetical protein ACFCUO_11340 [Rhodospirillales bacterium]